MKQTNLYNEDVKAALAAFELPWQQLSGKNILVLGATGLIGGCLVDMLMQHEGLDYQVYAAGRNEERANRRFSAYLDSGHYHFLPFDVTAPLSVDISFDYIVDAAGGACPQLYSEDPVGVMKSNIFGVDNLLRFGLQHGLKKLVYVSSGEVYGEGDGRVFEESYSGYIDPTTVRACYPSAKRASETLCICYAHQYGIEVSIARPSHIYGPFFTENDNRVYAQFIRNVLRGEDIVLKSKGEAFRSWTYVVDCAMALLCILLKGGNGGPIGAIGVFPTEIPEGRGEPELGYWIARPYWGQGLIPEAVEAMLRRQFREMGAERVWCAHFPGNERSRRVQEKCGFRHVCDTPPSPWPDGTERPGVCQAITRQEWEVRHG